MRYHSPVIFAVALCLSGCVVSAKKYNDAVQQQESLSGEVDALKHKIDSLNAEHKSAVEALQTNLQAQSAQVEKLTKAIESMRLEAENLKAAHSAETADLQKKIDKAQADLQAKVDEADALRKSADSAKAAYAKKIVAIKVAIGSVQKMLDDSGEPVK